MLMYICLIFRSKSSNYARCCKRTLRGLLNQHVCAFSTDLLFQVTFASLVGGEIQNPTCQVYVLITEKTANANDINSLCAEQLGLDTMSLVTANGLPIEDSDGTRGNF